MRKDERDAAQRLCEHGIKTHGTALWFRRSGPSRAERSGARVHVPQRANSRSNVAHDVTSRLEKDSQREKIHVARPFLPPSEASDSVLGTNALVFPCVMLLRIRSPCRAHARTHVNPIGNSGKIFSCLHARAMHVTRGAFKRRSGPLGRFFIPARV